MEVLSQGLCQARGGSGLTTKRGRGLTAAAKLGEHLVQAAVSLWAHIHNSTHRRDMHGEEGNLTSQLHPPTMSFHCAANTPASPSRKATSWTCRHTCGTCTKLARYAWAHHHHQQTYNHKVSTTMHSTPATWNGQQVHAVQRRAKTWRQGQEHKQGVHLVPACAGRSCPGSCSPRAVCLPHCATQLRYMAIQYSTRHMKFMRPDASKKGQHT